MVQTRQQTDIEAAAIARMLEFSAAMLKGDPEALEELLAPDFTYTHMNGLVEPGDEIIEARRKERRSSARMDFDQMSVRTYPNTTIVNGLNHMRIDYDDRPPLIFDAHFTGVWVDVDGTSKLVVYHSTRVPDEE
ncbi:MAG: nuclear transport factor 2 family protein [Chloroflexi bacterium]|nr:nuclear transport factor 2 family protein [Chloroflexota bacterium]